MESTEKSPELESLVQRLKSVADTLWEQRTSIYRMNNKFFGDESIPSTANVPEEDMSNAGQVYIIFSIVKEINETISSTWLQIERLEKL